MSRITGWIAMAVASGLLAGARAASPDADPKPTADKAAPERVADDSGAVELQALSSSGRKALADGRWPEAVALFEKARKLDTKNSEAAFGLSAALIELNRFAEALPLLEELRKAVPDHPMVKNNLAWVYVKCTDPGLRNPAKAIKLAREAVLDQPSDYSIWNTLAEAYYANEQYDRALRAAESAWRLSRLAGVTNTAATRELVIRCRKAAGNPAVGTDEDDDRPQPK